MPILCGCGVIASTKVREEEANKRVAMEAFARSKCWRRRGCLYSLIVGSVRLTDCKAAKMASAAAPASFAQMAAKKS